MARPLNPNTVRLGTLKVKPEVAEGLNQLAELDGRTINDVVREALREYFKKRGIDAGQ